MKTIACIGILFIALIFTTGIAAKSYANEDLGLEVSYHDNYLEITNKSNCELKELYFALAHVDTKNELSRHWDEAAAYTSVVGMCKSCFTASHGSLPPKYSLQLEKSDFIKGDGESLTSKYKLNFLVVNATQCENKKAVSSFYGSFY